MMVLALAPAAASAAGAWTARGNLQVPRASPTLTELANGKVLAAGGNNQAGGPNAPVASAELFDPATGAWTLTGSLAGARSGHTATLLSGPNCAANCGKVLVAGGSGLASVEIYDPVTGVWWPTAPMASARTAHTATLLADGKVLVTGGSGPGGTLATAEVFNPVTETWSPAKPMAGSRRDHTATRLVDGRVLVTGGRGAALEELGSAELFDPVADEWTSGGALQVPRTFHSATLLIDGRVLVAGGRAGAPIELAPRRSAEIFDPAAAPAGRWSATASMAVAHSSHIATRLADGTVLVAGSSVPPSAPIATAERYDPATATWRYTGSLTAARGFTGFALLSGPGCAPRCGQVLAAGGSRQPAQISEATDVYDAAAPTPPGNVGDLAATATSTSSITLSFTAPPTIESFPPPAGRYAIRQSTSPITDAAAFEAAAPLCGGVCTFAPNSVGERLTLDVTGLDAGVTYHFALRALDDTNGIGALSNDASATTTAVALGADTITGVTARALSARGVELSFSAPGAGGVSPAPSTEYVIRQASGALPDAAGMERATALCGGVCAFAPPAVGAVVTLRVTDLEPNRVYHYAVRARMADGQLGARSNVATIRTPRDRVAPGRVKVLRARALPTRITLRFATARSDGAIGPPVRRYVIKQASTPITSARRFLRAFSLCAKGGCRYRPTRVGQILSLNVTRLKPGRTYYFAVRPRDDAGNFGPRSQTIRVKTPRAARR